MINEPQVMKLVANIVLETMAKLSSVQVRVLSCGLIFINFIDVYLLCLLNN